MSHLLLAVALAAFMAPAVAAGDNSSLSRLAAGVIAGRVSAAGASAAVSVVPMAANGGSNGAGKLEFAGAVVIPAGGAHPVQPLVERREVVQTIGSDDYHVLEIVYR